MKHKVSQDVQIDVDSDKSEIERPWDPRSEEVRKDEDEKGTTCSKKEGLETVSTEED